MKFAKELDRELIPEWRACYLNYKQGKKKLKAIQRALRNVNQTPRLGRRGAKPYMPSPNTSAPQYAFVNRGSSEHNRSDELRSLAMQDSQGSLQFKPSASRSTLSHEVRRSPEEQPLRLGHEGEGSRTTRYGSISSERGAPPPSLKLPGAALDAASQASPYSGASATSAPPFPKAKSVCLPDSIEAAEDGKPMPAKYGSSSLPLRYRSIFSPKRVNSTPGDPVSEAPRPLLRRVFSMTQKARPPSPGDVPAEAYRELDLRQAEFFQFLDLELEKIEVFYRRKEDEATERLKVLKEQLHIMRDRRLDELIAQQAAKMKAKEKKRTGTGDVPANGAQSSSEGEGRDSNAKHHLLDHLRLNPIESAIEAVRSGRSGKTSKAIADLATTMPRERIDSRRDFVRRPDVPDVSYQTARRKLKVALQEYYRGLELLKSYALLNRTAFRKINKKYDKTVNARPTMRYMAEKVNKAWFVQSDVIEGHIRTVEDLYARYFEKGNHKVAVGKLRIKSARPGDYTENSFRNGLTLAAGLVLCIQGLVYGAQLLQTDDEKLHVDTSYLFQLYAGYFLMNLLFLLFCLACRIWHQSKINYVFVFEYDTRHHLDWRQLCELPCFYFFLLGLFMWLNFSQFGGETMYIYYPVILLSVTVVVLMLPLPLLYFRSRQWLLYSMWRLLLAGLYPVEFRDFYLGDMFCSLTYAMGNIELFFCLYANEWDDPPMCNSSHSRLLGFFTALPAVWRALQCLRRYYDTRNVFPHLVNCGKYTATIVFYITLSIYRIDKSHTHRAIFITFAIINSIYTSVWDVVMDWSLGDPYAENRFLRKTLGYKKVWTYYVAMLIDPMLRFNWIFYTFIPLQLQHSAVTSFLVAFSEVMRRGMWTLFRVENEHCTNVGRFRASRDVPLPYDIPTPPETSARVSEDESRKSQRPSGAEGSTVGTADHEPQQGHPSTASAALDSRLSLSHAQTFASAVDLENQLRHQRTRSSARRRASIGAAVDEPPQPSPLTRGLTRVGTILRDAHAQDFERKKKPELGRSGSKGGAAGGLGRRMRGMSMQDGNEDDSDDEDDEVRSGEQTPEYENDGMDEDPRTWDGNSPDEGTGLGVRAEQSNRSSGAGAPEPSIR